MSKRRKQRSKPSKTAHAAKVVQTLNDLENPICELVRATRMAFEMQMRDAEQPDDEPLALFAVEQAERLALDLRATFYKIIGHGEGEVRS